MRTPADGSQQHQAARRRGSGDEEGQVLPALLAVLLSILAMGMWLFQVGRASDLRAGAQTAADAAALAGARDLRDQLTGGIVALGVDGPLFIDDDRIRSAAVDYAGRNGARLTDYQRDGLDVLVVVETLRGIGDQSPPGFERGGGRGTARARASLNPVYTLGIPGTIPIGGGTGVPESELEELAEQAGVDLGDIPPNSALRVNGSNCETGIDVLHLQEALKIAIIQAEVMLGGPIVLNSAYRTYDCQAALYATVTGPVAPPGQSMHNYGLAVDVSNYGALASVAAQVGMCQPLPSDDAVHFSVASGPECGGVAGALNAGQAFGGAASSFVTYEIRLVPYEG